MMQRLTREFFAGDSVQVARGLLGAIMTRKVAGVLRSARIVETEAYLGPRDLASHSSKGRTSRTDVLFGPPGHAYVYIIYGMYDMFNIVVGREGEAHAVLLRAAQPLDAWDADLTGPGKLARAFAITRADNRMDLTSDQIAILFDPAYTPRIIRTRRIGVEYAAHWQKRLLRFIDMANPVGRRLRR